LDANYLIISGLGDSKVKLNLISEIAGLEIVVYRNVLDLKKNENRMNFERQKDCNVLHLSLRAAKN